MKKINFKAILVVVLALVLALAFTACDGIEPTTSVPPTTSSNTPTNNPPTADDFLAVIEALDLTIDNLADLTDRFELNVEFYAVVNDVEYKVAILGNFDFREAAANADNNLAVEVTSAGDVAFGLYYSGAEDAFFLYVPDEDAPAKSISRYLDGFDFLTALHYLTDPVEGGFLSQIPVDEVSLADMVGDYLSYATLVFNDFEETTDGTVTTYDFTLDSAMIQGIVPMLGSFLPAELIAEVGGVVDSLFGTDGFDINTFTIPDFDFHLIFEADEELGLIGAGITLDVPAFTFKINADDEGTPVNAFNLEAGINFIVDSVSTAYTVDVNVPTIANGKDYDGAGGDDAVMFTYFSPLNVNTEGTFRSGEDYVSFIIQSDINPFFFMDSAKLAAAKAYVRIDSWEGEEGSAGEDAEFELVIIDGDVYVTVLDEIVEGVRSYDCYTLDIQEAVDLIGDIIEDIDTLDIPEWDQIFVPEEEDENAVADPTEPDIMALLDVITGAGGLISEEGVLTIDKDVIVDVIMALGIDDIYFDGVIVDEITITGELVYDAVDAEKLVGARGEVDIVTATYAPKGETTGVTFYSPADFIFCQENGTYKLVDGTYTLIGEEEVFTGARYTPLSYVEDTNGGFIRTEEDTYNYYAEVNFNDVEENDVLTVEIGEIVDSADVKLYDAVLTIDYDVDDFVGFLLEVKDYTGEVEKLIFDLELSGFDFAWSEAGYVTNEDCVAPANAAEYEDVLEDVTAEEVLEEVQDMLYGMFGYEIEVRDDSDYSYITSYYGYNEDSVTIDTPTKEGYTFDKWVDEDGNTIPAPTVFGGEKYMTIYAVFILNTPV